MDVEAEIRRVAKLLENEIRGAGSNKSAVERKLGLGGGYFTKVVKGGIELKLRHVLEVAGATGFDVAEFFHKAFPGHDETTTSPSSGSGTAELRVAVLTEAEVEKRIEAAVAHHIAPLATLIADLTAALPPKPKATPLPTPRPHRAGKHGAR